MARRFGAATSHAIDIGANAAIVSLTDFSILVRVRVTTLTNARCIFGGRYTASGVSGIMLRLSGTTGDIEIVVAQATTASQYTSNSTPIPLNRWVWVLADYSQGASPRSHIYVKDYNGAFLEATYGTSNNGSGNKTAETGGTVLWGNRYSSSAVSNVPIQADVEHGMLFNRVISPAEAEAIVARLGLGAAGPSCVSWHPFMYGSTELDLSPFGNHGTVTGATVVNPGPTKWKPSFVRRWVRTWLSSGGTTYTYTGNLTAGSSLTMSKEGQLPRSLVGGSALTRVNMAGLVRALAGGSSLSRSNQAQQSHSLDAGSALVKSSQVGQSHSLTCSSTTTRTIQASLTKSLTAGSALSRSMVTGLVRSLTAGSSLTMSVLKVIVRAADLVCGSALSMAKSISLIKSLTGGSALSQSKQAQQAHSMTAGSSLSRSSIVGLVRSLTSAAVLSRSLGLFLTRTFTVGSTLTRTIAIGLTKSLVAGSALTMSVVKTVFSSLIVIGKSAAGDIFGKRGDGDKFGKGGGRA